MAERALLSHNLKKPTSEDHHAATLIQSLRTLSDLNAGKVRQPNLL